MSNAFYTFCLTTQPKCNNAKEPYGNNATVTELQDINYFSVKCGHPTLPFILGYEQVCGASSNRYYGVYLQSSGYGFHQIFTNGESVNVDLQRVFVMS